MKDQSVKFNTLTIYLVLCLCSLFSLSVKASTLSTPFFTLPLPEGMQEVLKHEAPNENVLQYVYQTAGDINAAGMQLRITQLVKTPAPESELDAFQTNALGAMIAIFTESHKLSLKDQKAALSSKPNSVKFGNHLYKSVSMHFPNQDVEFLITIVKNSTYMFYLIGVDKEEAKRKAYLDLLRNQLSAIEFR